MVSNNYFVLIYAVRRREKYSVFFRIGAFHAFVRSPFGDRMEIDMLMTKKQFFTEELDFNISELSAAKELFESGDEVGAEHIFAEYMRASLDSEHYFELGREHGTPGRMYEASKSLLENADEILAGKVRSVGYTHDYGGEIQWGVNGSPDQYREWTFQLNRHYAFRTVAAAYLESGDEKYAKGFERIINGWLDQAICPGWPVPNRCAKYPMWRTISAGIRMSVSWPYAVHAFIKSPSISDATWVRIAMSLWEHAEFIKNSPSSLNWLDFEMSGLNSIGCMYKFFKKSEEWRTHAFTMMMEEIKTQLYPDGFQCELSTGYQDTITATHTNVYNVAKHYGIDVPEDYVNSIKLLYTMYPKIMRPDGRTPSTNDSGEEPVSIRMKNMLKNFPGEKYAEDILAGKVSEMYPLDVVFPYAGIITMRTGWGEDDMWVFFESGPLGAGHQHEDKLNVNLSAYGKNIINTLGNYPYDGSPMRSMHLSSRAHNTGLVDGAGQNRTATKTPWTGEFVNKKSDLEVNVGGDIVVACGKYNEGYGKDLLPATHERKVIFFREGLDGSKPFVVLLDKFTADDEKPHKYEIIFPLYDVPVTLRGRHATIDAGDGVTLEVVTHAALATITGQSGPSLLGWRKAANRLDPPIPTPVLSIYDYSEAKNFATVLYPTPDGKAPEIGIDCDEEKFTITLDGKEYTFSYNDERIATEKV